MSHVDRELFAQRWAAAIAGTSYVSMGRRGLTAHLLQLTHQLAEAALAAEFDPSVGERIGADMVAAHFTGTETLGKTVAVITEQLPDVLDEASPGLRCHQSSCAAHRQYGRRLRQCAARTQP